MHAAVHLDPRASRVLHTSIPSFPRRSSLHDRLEGLCYGDHNDGDHVLDELDDPLRRAPESLFGVFFHFAGSADEAFGFGLLWRV